MYDYIHILYKNEQIFYVQRTDKVFYSAHILSVTISGIIDE